MRFHASLKDTSHVDVATTEIGRLQRAFAQGLDIGDDTPTRPARLELCQVGEQSLVRITLTEGRYHQVKRMCQTVGKPVIKLKRLSMGSLKLDDSLREGEYRPLTEEEIGRLKEC